MPESEKQILLLCCKYFEFVNNNLNDLERRVLSLELAMKSEESLSAAFEQGARAAARRNFPPNLSKQLSAIRSEVEKLRG